MSGSVTRTTSLPSDTTAYSEVFGASPGDQLTIHTSVLATSTPTGAFTLEVYNLALADWETFADATSKLSAGDPAAGAASAVSNFENPPLGKCRVKYTATSLGSSTAATLVIVIERGRKGP